jgi:hypothetical protein
VKIAGFMKKKLKFINIHITDIIIHILSEAKVKSSKI